MTSDEFRAELKALGLSQRALALRLGLATTTVNRWALALAPVPRYAVAYLDLRRELAEISRRLFEAGLAKPMKAPLAPKPRPKPKRYWEDETL